MMKKYFIKRSLFINIAFLHNIAPGFLYSFVNFHVTSEQYVTIRHCLICIFCPIPRKGMVYHNYFLLLAGFSILAWLVSLAL